MKKIILFFISGSINFYAHSALFGADRIFQCIHSLSKLNANPYDGTFWPVTNGYDEPTAYTAFFETGQNEGTLVVYGQTQTCGVRAYNPTKDGAIRAGRQCDDFKILLRGNPKSLNFSSGVDLGEGDKSKTLGLGLTKTTTSETFMVHQAIPKLIESIRKFPNQLNACKKQWEQIADSAKESKLRICHQMYANQENSLNKCADMPTTFVEGVPLVQATAVHRPKISEIFRTLPELTKDSSRELKLE